MKKQIWYRNVDWSDDIKQEFFLRLSKSKTNFNKAQYLVIQAMHLLHDNRTEYALREALSLIDYMKVNYFDDFNSMTAYWTAAICNSKLNNIADAIVEFESCFNVQRKRPTHRGIAHLDFGEMIVEAKRVDLYDEVIDVFEEFGKDDKMLANNSLRHETVLARIYGAKGDKGKAKEHAIKALEAIAVNKSVFAKHPKLGLVKEVDPKLLEELNEMAGL